VAAIPFGCLSPAPAIAAGIYAVTINGTANDNPVDLNATLVVFPGQENHPIDVCLFTGNTLAAWAATTGVGAIGFASNSACSQSGSIAGAAGVDYTFLTADLNAGTVTVTADPTKCCSYNLSTNGFTVSSGLFAIPYGIAQGTLKLQFSNASQDVSGSLDIGGCTLNPYCVAIPYVATISGQFSSPLQ
jgi:hypothetical protein